MMLSEKTESLLTREETGEQKKLIVYGERWWIITVFACLEMANALMWVTFAPISDLTQHYFHYHSTYGTTTSVNMLANIFLILYAPGSILGIMMVKYYRPRTTILFAGILTAIGALLRYVGTSFFNEMGYESAYITVFLGQTLAAIAQPMFLNFPPALASIWFPITEREIATTIGSMCSPIGNAIGQIIPIIFVEKANSKSDDDDGYDVVGMSDLMLTEFILCLLPLVAAYFLFKDAPPTPPSQSTKLKLDKKKLEREQQLLTAIAEEEEDEEDKAEEGLLSSSDRSLGQSDLSNSSSFHASSSSTTPSALRKRAVAAKVKHYQEDSWALVKKEVTLLMKNKDYLILFTVFSIGVGFFNAILTLLNQIIEPFGYSNDDAGTFGAVFILAGLAGAGIVGKIMEKTKAYKSLLQAGIIFCCVVTCFMLLMLFSNNFWPLCIAFGLMGMFVLPLLPIMMENCAECTYPVPEEVSMGILFAGCNILGLGFIFAIQYLIEVPRFAPPPFLPANFFILGVLIVAGILLFFYNGEYKRLKHEQLEHLEDSSLSRDFPRQISGEAYRAPPSPSQFGPAIVAGGSGGGGDDSSMVRVTDNSSQDNSVITSSMANTSSLNFWNSRSTAEFSGSKGSSAQQLHQLSHNHNNPPSNSNNNHHNNKKKKHNNNNKRQEKSPKEVLVNVASSDSSLNPLTSPQK